MYVKQNYNNIDCALVSAIILLKYLNNININLNYDELGRPYLKVFDYPFDKEELLYYDRANKALAKHTLLSGDPDDITIERIILSNKTKINNLPNIVYHLQKYSYMIINLSMIKYHIIDSIEKFHYFVNQLLLPDIHKNETGMVKLYGCGTSNHDLVVEIFSKSQIRLIDPLHPEKKLVYESKDFLNFLSAYKYFYISFNFLDSARRYERNLAFSRDNFYLPKIYHISSDAEDLIVYLIWKSQEPNIKILKNLSIHQLLEKMDNSMQYNNTNLDCVSIQKHNKIFIGLAALNKDTFKSIDNSLEIISNNHLDITEVKPLKLEPKVTADGKATFEVNFFQMKRSTVFLKLFNPFFSICNDGAPMFKITELKDGSIVNAFTFNKLILQLEKRVDSDTQQYELSLEKPVSVTEIEASFKSVITLKSLDYLSVYDIKNYEILIYCPH